METETPAQEKKGWLEELLDSRNSRFFFLLIFSVLLVVSNVITGPGDSPELLLSLFVLLTALFATRVWTALLDLRSSSGNLMWVIPLYLTLGLTLKQAQSFF